MTELGVYILGAMALGILAAAGISVGSPSVVLCAVLASGAAYLSQLGAANTVAGGGKLSVILNAVFMVAALVAWAIGAVLLF